MSEPVTSPTGLLAALILDGNGGARSIDWQGVDAWTPEQGPLWVHMDRKHPQAQHWLYHESGLPRIVCDALLTEDTRPRSTIMHGGSMVILRGVNLNPGAEPDDMISLRMWIESTRIITLRFPRLLAVGDVRHQLEAGNGPANISQLVNNLARAMTDRMEPVHANLVDIIDDLEERALEDHGRDLRVVLGSMRRQAITLRRHLAPQRDALAHLASNPDRWLTEADRHHLRESADRTMRYVEDLDALRERAALIQDELLAIQSDRLNRNMYLLSLVATIFLPLGLITGLLGINVGGIPGANSSLGFVIVTAALLLLAGAELIILKRLKMI